MANKTWYITGASKGLGLSLVKKLLAAGDRVAATSRSGASLREAVGIVDDERFLALTVDLGDEQSVARSIKEAVTKFGAIDVVVNNAGYGIGGSIEELSQEEIHQNFDINVFGTISVIKHVLPVMRAQQSGHIINISSIAGFAPAVGWAVYAASKYAIIGLSEVLAQDVKSFGIHVTVVAPGAFRTNFLSGDSIVLAKEPIDAYTDVRASHEKYLSMDGKQQGDPEKAADVFIKLAGTDQPPVRLFLGSDAFDRATAKIGVLQEELKTWKDLSFSTDFGS